VHLELGRGLRRAAQRAEEIGARTVQVFVDNPSAWKRRGAPPRHLDHFRERMEALDISPLAVHASYLVNLAGPDPGFRASSIEVLASDLTAAIGYGGRMVNVHTGSHRDTSVAAGIERVASAAAEVLRRARQGAKDVAGRNPGWEVREPMLVLENAAGGGWSVGSSIEELARIADRAAALGVVDERLGFCLDVAHAWGAGIAMDDPDAIDKWLDHFDRELGLARLALIHFNDSQSERGSRTDRHQHVGAGQIGPRGMGHLLTHPLLRSVPFVLETPGMDRGYDAINLDRCRALIAGVPLAPLPDAAFHLSRRAAKSAPADDDLDRGPATTRGARPRADRASRPTRDTSGRRR
jgi:deoxyribonuclease IV